MSYAYKEANNFKFPLVPQPYAFEDGIAGGMM